MKSLYNDPGKQLVTSMTLLTLQDEFIQPAKFLEIQRLLEKKQKLMCNAVKNK